MGVNVAEGANMLQEQGTKQFKLIKFYMHLEKSNAGGVAVSGLEMAQNSLRYSWTREKWIKS